MKNKVVLLIEDNPDDEELALLAFKKAQLVNQVVVAHDGAEAVDYLFGTGASLGQSEVTLPELVLLDLKLPKISGLEVLRRIRADPQTCRLPVVILTSSREEEDVIRSDDLGANSIIRKPVDFTQFGEAVRQLGLNWVVFNKRSPTQELI